MKAMILAAGRGERMKPLTDTCPKPLLKVHGIPLIVYHIKQLSKVGIKDIVINHAWLGQQIEDVLGNGEQWQVNIVYSKEHKALETAGGIINAMPLLLSTRSVKHLLEKPELNNTNGSGDSFLVINGDVFTDFDFNNIPSLGPDTLAHLWLVPNPEHNPKGDFCIKNGLLQNPKNIESLTLSNESYTYSGIALFKPEFFQLSSPQNKVTTNGEQLGKLPLAPMLRIAADNNLITASLLPATWTDVGTPERLAQLNL